MEYQRHPKERKTASASSEPVQTDSASAAVGGNDDANIDEDEDSKNGPSSSRGGAINAPSACSKALGIVDEREKATELVQFVLQSSQLNMKHLEAVNSLISTSFRKLCDEIM